MDISFVLLLIFTYSSILDVKFSVVTPLMTCKEYKFTKPPVKLKVTNSIVGNIKDKFELLNRRLSKINSS